MLMLFLCYSVSLLFEEGSLTGAYHFSQSHWPASSWVSVFQPPSIVKVWPTMPGFLCGCQASCLRSSSLCQKHFTLQTLTVALNLGFVLLNLRTCIFLAGAGLNQSIKTTAGVSHYLSFMLINSGHLTLLHICEGMSVLQNPWDRGL